LIYQRLKKSNKEYPIFSSDTRLNANKKNMSRFFSLLFLFISVSLIAEETRVSGNIPGAGNKEIRIIAYTDQVTYLDTVIAQQFIDTDGNFSMTLNLTETIYIRLDIEYFNIELYLEPGENYKITADSITFQGNFRPYYKKELLNCTITSGKNDLNKLISDFNKSYNQFISNHFEEVYKRRKKELIQDFRDSLQGKYENIKNNYFQDYMRYKLASVYLAAMPTSQAKLFGHYFYKQPVLYQNTEYMYFFNQFFSQFLTSGSRQIKRRDLLSTINYQNSFSALIDSLGKDTLLRNEVIRELVLFNGIAELYHSPDYSKKSIINILEQAKTQSKFPEHQLIASNLIRSLEKLQPGTPTPGFSLPKLNGEIFNFPEQNSKPVYLSFMTTWSYACIAEMELMQKLYEKYKDQIDFVTVSLDQDTAIINKFVNEKKYPWTFLYNGDDYQLLYDYGVKTFPAFVLIDSNMNIVQYPAYKPSEIIEDTFQRMIRESTKKD
jgi:thiol-disulfide isomerase/thioredoxin